MRAEPRSGSGWARARAAALGALFAAAAAVGCEKKSEIVSAGDRTELRIGDALLTIAPGSLPFDSVIVADVRRPEHPAVNGEIRSLVYEFTPEVVVFDPPALLELRSTSGRDGAVIARWDEAGKRLIGLPTIRDGALLRAAIHRFAKYVEAEVGDQDWDLQEDGKAGRKY